MPSGAVDLAQGQAIRRQRRRDQISTHPYLEVKSRAQKLKVKQVECVCVCVCVMHCILGSCLHCTCSY